MSIVLVDQPEGGKIAINGPQATVTVESETYREVSDTAAKVVALNAARGFLTRPGISGQSGPYPVDAEGNQLVDLTQGLPPGSRYRQDFTIQEGM
jgi:hypothetical protein